MTFFPWFQIYELFPPLLGIIEADAVVGVDGVDVKSISSISEKDAGSINDDDVEPDK